jgi:hypothetical protein
MKYFFICTQNALFVAESKVTVFFGSILIRGARRSRRFNVALQIDSEAG